MVPQFVVASTGRAGSGYISEVFTHAGIRCGHEEFWNPFGTQAEGLIGDSSWCVVPDLDTYHGVVFHQVRHPLDVITSLVCHPTDYGPYRDWQCRLFDDTDDSFMFAMLVYVIYNRTIEQRARLRWQVEQVNVATLTMAACLIGQPITDPHEALETVPHDWNHHRTRGRYGWGDLPDCALKTELLVMTAEYGYL